MSSHRLVQVYPPKPFRAAAAKWRLRGKSFGTVIADLHC